MDISVNGFQRNLVFNAKNPKFSKEYMDKMLLPLLDKEDVSLDIMVKKSGYTIHAVMKWFLESVGMSAAKFFRLRKQERLRSEFNNFYNKNTPELEIAKSYNYSVGWVKKQFFKLKIKEPQKDLQLRLMRRVPPLLNAGCSLKDIAEDVECSSNTLRRWIRKTDKLKEESIVEYRHNNNIKLKKEYSEEELELKQSLAILFAEGKGLKEAAKVLNISQNKALYWKNKFNLKTKKDEAIERMKTLVPEFMLLKMSLNAMAREIGDISAATVRRFIKDEYGKNYIEFRMNKKA